MPQAQVRFFNMPNDNRRVIKVESILGGHSPTTHFAAPDQFRASIGINPSLAINDTSNDPLAAYASGLLRPAGASAIGTTGAIPLWIKANPKDDKIYINDSQGSAYTINSALDTLTALGDGGTLTSASGNGCTYYDNYMYFAKNTDIARYGPLNGTPVFTGTYWTGTLGKTALVNTTYPVDTYFAISLPNHVLHRHSDGRLYIADVVDNKGTVHFIQTTKTTVEGDTDNGSTYNKVQVGYGLWPTVMESYGSDLAIAFVEGTNTATAVLRPSIAKIAFWDTTSANVNKITWVEFPDPLITAMKNVNGVLYVVSSTFRPRGFRLSRFVGGYSFEEVAYYENGRAGFPGAVDAAGNTFFFCAVVDVPSTAGSIMTFGLLKKALGSGIFNILSSSTGGTSTQVSALLLMSDNGLNGLSKAVPIF